MSLLATFTTSFSTNFGSKVLSLFYAVQLWFIFTVATYIYVFYFCCYEDERVSTHDFISLLLIIYYLYVLVQISCYKNVLCLSWLVSINQFTELFWKIYNALFSVKNWWTRLYWPYYIYDIMKLILIDLLNSIHWDLWNNSSGWFTEICSTISDHF